MLWPRSSASATEPLLPALMKPLLDRGFQPGGIALWMVPASLLLLFAVRGMAGFLADLALAKITQDGLLSLRRDMFARLLDARLRLFREQNATALSNTVVYEVQNGARLLVNAVIGLLKDSVALRRAAGLPAVPELAADADRLPDRARPSPGSCARCRGACTASPGAPRRPPTTWPTWSRKTCWRPAWCACMARSRRRPAASTRLSNALRRLAMKTAVASASITPLTHMLAAAALSAVICIALWQSRDGITVGGFAAFITAMLMLIAPIKRLSEVASPITRGLAALQRAMT